MVPSHLRRRSMEKVAQPQQAGRWPAAGRNPKKRRCSNAEKMNNLAKKLMKNYRHKMSIVHSVRGRKF
jgi:hypothetical protein